MELARQNEGKHGSYRAIVVFKSEFRTFFVYAFPKSKMSNINEKDLLTFKSRAKDNLAFTDEEINLLLKSKIFTEIL
jgi:hypothetical protein